MEFTARTLQRRRANYQPIREGVNGAERGGFTFEPRVGFHEDVVEIDFASLYPNIICVHNLSPETVRCGCHDSDDVPGLGYSVCDEPGFVTSVLQFIIGDRAALKRRTRETDDPDVSNSGRTRSSRWPTRTPSVSTSSPGAR